MSKDVDDFPVGFAKSEHEPRFESDRRLTITDAAKNFKRSVEIGNRTTDRTEKSRYRFGIVIIDLRQHVGQTVHGVPVSGKITRQDFDGRHRARFRADVPDRFDRSAKPFGAAVLQIVSGNAGQHDMREFQTFYGLGNSMRFGFVDRFRHTGLDAAKPAVSSTDGSHKQKSGRLSRITFHPVRTLGVLANRLHVQRFE